MTTNTTSGFDQRIIWQMIWRRKWIVIGSFVLSTAIGLVLAMTAKPLYRVSSTVLLREIDLEFNTGKNVMSPRVSATDDLDLLKTKILSPALLDELIDKVGLLNDTALTAQAKDIRAAYPKLGIEEIKRSLLLEKLREKILSIRVHGNNMIQIDAEHGDPEVAYNVVSTLIKIFIEQTQQTEMSGLQSGMQYSNEQLAIYKKRLDDAEARLQRLTTGSALNKLDSRQMDDAHAVNLRAYVLATGNQLDLENRILRDATANLSGAGPSPARSTSPELDNLFNEQVTTLALLANQLKKSDVGEQQIFQLNKEIKDLDAAMQIEAQALAGKSVDESQRAAWAEAKMATVRIRFLERKKQAFNRLLTSYDETLKASLTREPRQAMTEERLRDEIEQSRQMYQMFLKQKEGTELESALRAAQSPFLYRLIDPPQRPLSSIAMSKRTRLMIGCLVGLGLGLVLAVGLEQIDRSLKTIEEVETHLQTPVYGLMPKLVSKEFQFTLDSKEAVDIQRVATKLAKQLLRGKKDDVAAILQKSKTIMITSSVLGEGKSTYSAHLAVCLAAMLKPMMVLLIDADLRRGVQHKTFELDNAFGLGNLLEGEKRDMPHACLHPTGYGKLYVLTSGRSTQSPLTLFSSERLAKALERLKKYYQLIILDTPPVIPVNDALLLSRYADTTLYVVKAGKTPREIAKRGIGLVRTTECHFSGVIMNNMQQVLPYYYSHDYYKYDYDKQHQPLALPPPASANGSTKLAETSVELKNNGANGTNHKEFVSDTEAVS